MGFNWTPTAIDTLRTRLAEEATASQIALDLGTTKNSVIGKAHRLGFLLLSKVRRPPGRPRLDRPRAEVRVRRRVREAAQVMWCEPEPDALNLTLLELSNSQCHWPVTPDHEFKFCGHEVVPGKSYCLAHCQKAYVPPRSR